MNLAVISDTLASMIRIATPLMLMALGGLLCQRAGVFNIALEGFSLVGAFAAIAVDPELHQRTEYCDLFCYRADHRDLYYVVQDEDGLKYLCGWGVRDCSEDRRHQAGGCKMAGHPDLGCIVRACGGISVHNFCFPVLRRYDSGKRI